MAVQSVMYGAKPHQNDLLLPGQQVLVIPLRPWHRERTDGSLLADADIFVMLFSSGRPPNWPSG